MGARLDGIQDDKIKIKTKAIIQTDALFINMPPNTQLEQEMRKSKYLVKIAHILQSKL